MVLNSGMQNQRVRDEIGTQPSIQQIFKVKTETMIVERNPVATFNLDIGTHFVLDHPVNGILDSATLELDTGLGGTTNVQVFNDGNTYNERFNILADVKLDGSYTQYTFVDTDNTTADITTTGQVDF